MTNQDEDPNSKSSFFGVLNDIGKILANALIRMPFIAAVVLVLIIVAVPTIVAIIRGFIEAFYAFLVLAFFIVVGVFLIEVRAERGKIRAPFGEKLGMEDNTVIANQLSDEQKQDILAVLRGAAQDVADELHIPLNLIRSNVFGVDNKRRMRMLRELTFNMNREEELSISMPAGYGSTGRCFKSGKPNIAILREGWGENIIEGEELCKVHPELQWIISVPIPPGGDKEQPIWVLNVDGLSERRGEGELRRALGRLFSWSQLIYLIIGKGNNKGE